MTPLNVQRLITLIKARYPFILAGAFVTMLGALLIGFTVPYIYRSEALIQIPQARSYDQYFSGDNSDVIRTANLFRSTRLLVATATKMLEKQPEQYKLMIPHAISKFDIEERLRVLVRGIIGQETPHDQLLPGDSPSPEILANLMERHVRVEPDVNLRVIKVLYEAGTPELAKQVCEQLVEQFVVLVGVIEQQELQKQEKYLEDAIVQQMDNIKQVEEKMRLVVEKYPELTIAGEQRGASTVAQRYLEQRDSIKKLEKELTWNSRFLNSVQGDLTGKAGGDSPVTDVTSKLVEELHELEANKFRYTQVAGYSSDHPEIKKLQERIDALKKVLSTPPREPARVAGGSGLKRLLQKTEEIGQRNRTLALEKEQAREELKRSQLEFKELVKVNFEFESLTRELQSSVQVTTELYRDLQKTRLAMAGVTGKAVILSSPSLSVHASNISVRKRSVFGFFVGAIIAVTLLILHDLLNPQLLSTGDLAAFAVESVGPFRSNPRSYNQIASWLTRVRDQMLNRTERKGGIITAAYIAAGKMKWQPQLKHVLALLAARGLRLGVVEVRDPENWSNPYDWKGEGIEHTEIVVDDLPAQAQQVLEAMAARCDWVFVLIPEIDIGLPVEGTVAAHVDAFLYLAQMGHTSLRAVGKVNQQLTTPTRQFAIVFAPAAPQAFQFRRAAARAA